MEFALHLVSTDSQAVWGRRTKLAQLTGCLAWAPVLSLVRCPVQRASSLLTKPGQHSLVFSREHMKNTEEPIIGFQSPKPKLQDPRH